MSLWYLQFDNVHKKQIMFLVWIWSSMLLASRFGYRLNAMFNFLGSWTLSSKFSNLSSEVGVDMRRRAPHKIWLMLERKARISGSPHHSSTPLLLWPILQMSNLKTYCRQAWKRSTSNMMPPASHAMTKPCPVRDSATLTHRLNRFQNLLFISGKLPEPRYFKIALENWASWASIGYYLKG